MPFGREGEYGVGGQGASAGLTAGKVRYDPQAIESSREQWRLPFTLGTLPAGPGALMGRAAARVPIAAAKSRALVNALRRGRSGPEELMFSP